MNKRIIPLDGLRALCAMGVIWIHIWNSYGNPQLKLGPVDLYRAIAFLGNGVDFFFVISGFCMYLVFADKVIDTRFIFYFLKKRVLRILPAFYVAVIFYAILNWKLINETFLESIIANFFMFQNFSTKYEISGPFWSIATEWHFYLIIPLLFIFKNNSIVKKVILLMFFSLFFYALVNLNFMDYSFWEKQILVRFPEFGWGIIVGYLYKTNYKPKKIFTGTIGLILGFLILYFGRIIMVTEVLNKLGDAAFLFKTFSSTIMTFGFAHIMFLVITETSTFSKILSWKPIQFLGKISYSIYLWHSAAIFFLYNFLTNLQFSNYNPIVGFMFVSILSIIFATVSYYTLEYFYVKQAKQKLLGIN